MIKYFLNGDALCSAVTGPREADFERLRETLIYCRLSKSAFLGPVTALESASPFRKEFNNSLVLDVM